MLLYLGWLALLLLVLFPLALHLLALVFRVTGHKAVRAVRAAYIILFMAGVAFLAALAATYLRAPGLTYYLLVILFLIAAGRIIHKRMNASGLTATLMVVLLLATLIGAEYAYSRYMGVVLSFGSMSMYPAIHPGELVYLNKRAYLEADPAYDELVAYFSPQDLGSIYLHRLVGMPGDQVAISGGQVLVNGSLVLRVTGSHVSGLEASDVEDFGPVTVPEGSYFFLADNISLGSDSREHGSIPRNHLLGRAEGVFWSWDESGRATDFRRIGHSLLPPPVNAPRSEENAHAQ